MAKTRSLPTWDTAMQEVGDGCFAYVQATGGLNISNAGLIVGPDHAIAVDALYVRSMTRAFQRAIRHATDRRVQQIVSTHFHADHTLGLNWFKPDVQIIAHSNNRRENARHPLDLAHYREVTPQFADELWDLEHRLPTATFNDSMSLYLGDRRIELLHLGHGHTTGDVLIYVPDAQLLYTGDVCFSYVTPATHDSNISNWIRILEQILAMKVRTIVPGHGPIGNRRSIETLIDYFKLVRREARRRYRSGMSARRAAADLPLGPYATWVSPDRVQTTVTKLYQEFRGKANKRISLRAARGG